MDRIQINASRSYDVLMDTGLISQAGTLIKKALGYGVEKVCIVTDDIVNQLYCTSNTLSASFLSSLTNEGYKISKFVFPHGETSKTLNTVGTLLEYLAQEQFTRSDCIIALGGGIPGDIAGFAAATYLRGIPFVQIPTTLLAAVDSSVGGKTGVNLKSGKNLAGAFWQPSLVLFDIDATKTLSKHIFLDGVAEAIKAGAIADASLFSYIETQLCLTHPKVIKNLVKRAIGIKQIVVEEDERDTGKRQLLNFGHTLGHAIEQCSNFSISHGHGIAMGMDMVCKSAERMGWIKDNCSQTIHDTLLRFGFPLDCPYTPAQLACAAKQDKKRMGNNLTLVIPVTLGNCRLMKIPISQLEAFIQAGV
ncbi:MAG: 3-dehydroquinate synthase [Anaerovoracaceae bacterium]